MITLKQVEKTYYNKLIQTKVLRGVDLSRISLHLWQLREWEVHAA